MSDGASEEQPPQGDDSVRPDPLMPAGRTGAEPIPSKEQGGAGAATRRRWARGALLASGGLLSLTLATAAYVVEQFTRASAPLAEDYGFSPFEVGVDWEKVRFPTSGGQTLSGWWFLRPESEKVVICLYGFRRRKADLLGIGSALWRAGNNVLLFDYRGHGEHVGTPISLGYREVEDALGAIAYVRGRLPAARIGLMGYSMGASVAIMAAAREPQVLAVAADSPFAAQRNAVGRQMRRAFRTGLPDKPVLFLADQLLAWRHGYRFRDVEPLREVRKIAPRPLLIINGTADQMMGMGEARALYAEAGQPKELWVLEGVGHCGAYFEDRAAYVERVCGFFARALDTGEAARQAG